MEPAGARGTGRHVYVRLDYDRELTSAEYYEGKDRQDDRGARAAPGVYFLHVDLGTQVRRSKVVLLE